MVPTGLGLFGTTTNAGQGRQERRVCFSPAVQALATLPLARMDSVEVFDQHVVCIMQQPQRPRLQAASSTSTHCAYAFRFQSRMQADSCADALLNATAEWPKNDCDAAKMNESRGGGGGSEAACGTKAGTTASTKASTSTITGMMVAAADPPPALLRSHRIAKSASVCSITSRAKRESQMVQQRQLEQSMLSSTAAQHTRTVAVDRPLGIEWIGTASVLHSDSEPATFISRVLPGSNASKMGLVEGLQVVNFNGVGVVSDKATEFQGPAPQGSVDEGSVVLTVLPNPTKWELIKKAQRRTLKSAGGKRKAPQLKYPAYENHEILVPGHHSPLVEMNVPVGSRVARSSASII